MRFRGGDLEIVVAHQDALEHTLLDVEALPEIIATEFDVRQDPPGIEIVDVRVAADGIGDELLPSVGHPFAFLGHEVHALILDEQKSAFVCDGLGDDGAQIGVF